MVSVDHPMPATVILRLAVPARTDHLPGQHYVVRLVAEDGYVAQRSYSVASAPSDPLIELAVDVLPDGEVSGYLAEVVRPGDELQVRGPIGGWFVWDGTSTALGVGGGSGVVPLVAMLRHARDLGAGQRLRLVAVARTRAELLYAGDLEAFGATVAFSREPRADRPTGRLAAADLLPLIAGRDTVFVCGSPGFAQAAGALLLDLGVAVATVRVEQFGPSG